MVYVWVLVQELEETCHFPMEASSNDAMTQGSDPTLLLLIET